MGKAEIYMIIPYAFVQCSGLSNEVQPSLSDWKQNIVPAFSP